MAEQPSCVQEQTPARACQGTGSTCQGSLAWEVQRQGAWAGHQQALALLASSVHLWGLCQPTFNHMHELTGDRID